MALRKLELELKVKTYGIIQDWDRTRSIDRALRVAALAHSRYELGTGGRNPFATTPFTYGDDGQPGSDCVGFVLWCWGYDRFELDFPVYGGWINTDSMMAAAGDGIGSKVDFKFTDTPQAGDAIVYPSVWKGGKRTPGHICIITRVNTDTSRWTQNLWKRPKNERKNFLRHLEVVDCAASWKRRVVGRAVQKTDGNWAWNKPTSRFIRFPERS